MQYYSDQKEAYRRPWAFFLSLLVHVALLLALMVGQQPPEKTPRPAQSRTLVKPLIEP